MMCSYGAQYAQHTVQEGGEGIAQPTCLKSVPEGLAQMGK